MTTFPNTTSQEEETELKATSDSPGTVAAVPMTSRKDKYDDDDSEIMFARTIFQVSQLWLVIKIIDNGNQLMKTYVVTAEWGKLNPEEEMQFEGKLKAQLTAYKKLVIKNQKPTRYLQN